MLKLFLNKSKGSITVMVTLLLIPTIFFTGFLTDLARIKLSGNQAVMAADNYGEAILTEYDYLLKELYGLFAISQNEEGKKAIEDLQRYMQTSFNPAADTIKWEHLAGSTGFMSGDYEGVMPYKNAKVEMDYKLIDSSRLSSQAVFSTQIGDFMKFRIVQTFADDKIQDTLLNALEQGQKAEKDSVVLDAKTDFDNAVSKLMEAMKEYYEVLKRINHYPKYLKNLCSEYEKVKKEFLNIANSDSYHRWRDYVDNEEAINTALTVEPEDRTEEDKKLIDIYEKYDEDKNARTKELEDEFNRVYIWFMSSRDDEIIDFNSFDDLADDLGKKADKVYSKMETAIEQREKLGSALAEDITEELKTGVEDSVKIFDELIANGDYSSQCYIDLAQKVSDNKAVNVDYQKQVNQQLIRLANICDEYMAVPAADEIEDYEEILYIRNYKDFQNDTRYSNLYKKLAGMFDEGDNEQEKKAKKQRDKADDARKNAEDELKESETTSARNIPDSIPIGDVGNSGGNTISNLIKSAASYFKMNSFGEAGNRLMLKFYVSAYDYGMFSNRVTNVKEISESDQSNGEKQEEAVSLTGIKMCKSVNYLYQAEMEYLYGGHKDSAANLNAARNAIVAFRSVVNMTSTYTIKEIDTAIRGIRDSLMWMPVLAISVEAALRLGITAVETAVDWKRLKEGESVALVKKDVDELEAFSAILGFLPDVKKSQNKGTGIKLNYNQYLLVMITFLRTSDQIAARTGDLITLNVNAVQQEVGEDGVLSELKFNMDDAYTAVETSCTVHIDFAVMPDSFAQKAVDDAVYDSLTEYEKNQYKFTVTRGY